MNSLKYSAVALLLALVSVPVFAADVVTMTTSVSHPTAAQGGANEGTVLINNNTNGDVRVRLDVRVIYSNGVVQRLTGISDPGTLGPGGGYFQSVYFIIPPDASLGTARFVAEVSASASGGGETETQSAPFEVTAQ